MRAFTLAVVLAVALAANAQERSIVVRVAQPESTPYPHLFLNSKNGPGTIQYVQSLRGTPLYVGIVIEGGRDREFGPNLAIRYAKWFMQNPDLKGMLVAYAHNDLLATALTDKYDTLLKNTAKLKPDRGSDDLLGAAIQYACRKLGAQQTGKPVRRIVLVITDPVPYGFEEPVAPHKMLQIAQDAQAVLVVEDNTPFQGAAGFSMRELEETTPGIVLRGDYSHGKPADSLSFHQQTEQIARLMDELYLVGLVPPTGGLHSKTRLEAYEEGAVVHPGTLLPFLRHSYWFLTRIKMPRGVTQFGPATKFGLRFFNGHGRLSALVSLKHSPLYVALVVQGGGDPVFYNDLPARYVKWFGKNPDLRGMMVEFARDEVKKGPPPSLFVRDRQRPQMTRDVPRLLHRIASYDPNQPSNSFDTALHTAIDTLAEQEPGGNVRRVLLIVSHSRSYHGPSFDPIETMQDANDAEVVIAAEDHSWTDEGSSWWGFGIPYGWGAPYANAAANGWAPWSAALPNWVCWYLPGGIYNPGCGVGQYPWSVWGVGWPGGGWSGGLAAGGTSTSVWGPIPNATLSWGGGSTPWGRFLGIVADATPGVVLHGGSHSQYEDARRESFRDQTKKLSRMLDELYRFKVAVSPSDDNYVLLRLITNGSLLKISPRDFSLNIDRRWEGEDQKKKASAGAGPAVNWMPSP